MTYCHSSWEFLNELKWGIFIPVLYSLTIWLASLLKCITGDRAHGESAASEQQVSIYTPKHNKPAATTSKTQKKEKKIREKKKKLDFHCFPPFLQHSWAVTTRRSHAVFLRVCLARCCSSKNDILVSSSEMGPCFQFPRERNLMRFSLQLCGFPAKFMKLGLAVRSPVEKTRGKSKYNNWVCRSVSVASLGVLLLNTKIIFCIEVYLL